MTEPDTHAARGDDSSAEQLRILRAMTSSVAPSEIGSCMQEADLFLMFIRRLDSPGKRHRVLRRGPTCHGELRGGRHSTASSSRGRKASLQCGDLSPLFAEP